MNMSRVVIRTRGEYKWSVQKGFSLDRDEVLNLVLASEKSVRLWILPSHVDR